MIDVETIHPTLGVIPISTVLGEVNTITHELSSMGHWSFGLIANQIQGLEYQIGHIIGATSETITKNTANGDITISEVGHNEAMSISFGPGNATANASASSTGTTHAIAVAETAAVSINGISDAVAVAYGDIVDATTTIG